MGGTVARIFSAAASGGTSELIQKKPFQDVTKDKPIGDVSSSARMLPGGALLGGLADTATNSIMPKKPEIPQPTPPPSTGDQAVQQAVSEAAQRRSRARGYRSTILSQMLPSSMRETFGG